MPDNTTSQFFAPDARGDSQSVYKILSDNTEALQTSEIRARNRQLNASPSPTLALDGIPGIPFERGAPNPDVFFQGEDIIYDAFLFHEGSPVSHELYDITVIVKASPRANNVIWQGTLDNGVYAQPGDNGYYEVWIPSTVTENFIAGSYHFHIQIRERVGAGKGRYDRKYVLLQTYFNIDYSNFSLRPETTANIPNPLGRSDVENTWPNAPDTIGKGQSSAFKDVFQSTE